MLLMCTVQVRKRAKYCIIIQTIRENEEKKKSRKETPSIAYHWRRVTQHYVYWEKERKESSRLVKSIAVEVKTY